MSTSKEYKTKDRFEIYTLLAAGCTLKEFKVNGTCVFFCFYDKELCMAVLSQLLSKKLVVYAHDMISAMRDARAIFRRSI